MGEQINTTTFCMIQFHPSGRNAFSLDKTINQDQTKE